MLERFFVHSYIKRILLGLLIFIPCTAMYAGSFGVGKYAGEFISIGVGARALGMGGAYVAMANDVTAGYWNPAGLSRIMYPEIALMHDERFGSLINYDYGAVAIPYGRSASLAFSVIRLGADGIHNTKDALIDPNGGGILDDAARIDYDKLTFFNAADWTFYLTYSRKHSDKFSYGFNAKLVRRDLGDNHANGIGFDVGLWYNPWERIMLGVNVQDVTTTLLAWDTGRNELISPTMKLGTAYMIDLFGGKIFPAFDVDVRFENRRSSANANLGGISFDFHGGFEYDFKNLFAFRSGMNDLGQFTVGAGVRLPKLYIDYSFAKFDAIEELGNTHRISLRFSLEEERFRRKDF
jgi:hypothetical protein